MKMGLVTWFVTQMESNVNVCELHCSRFKNFMIRYFNATDLAFLERFGWLVICFVSANMVDCLWKETVLQSFSMFHAPQKCYLLKINSHAFYAF
jgi:hypothetical protein